MSVPVVDARCEAPLATEVTAIAGAMATPIAHAVGAGSVDGRGDSARVAERGGETSEGMVVGGMARKN